MGLQPVYVGVVELVGPPYIGVSVNFGIVSVNFCPLRILKLLYDYQMFPLTQDVIKLMELVAVVHMIVFLGLMITSLLMRQLARFGFSHSWGTGAKDVEINGF